MVVELNAGSWESEVRNSKQPVLVDFWHDACVWCKRLEPVFSELAGQYEGRVKFAKLNIFASDENKQVSDTHGITGTPTLILFCEGRPVSEFVGYRDKQTLKSGLDDALSKASQCVAQSAPATK